MAVLEQRPHGRLDVTGLVFQERTQDAVQKLVGTAGGGMGHPRHRQVRRSPDRGGCDRLAKTIRQLTERRAHAQDEAG